MSTTELTSAERDALARLEKATGGPVIVLDVTSEPAADLRKCKTCGEPVRYLSEREAARITDAGWIHTATGERRAVGSASDLPQFDFHWAEPVPQCPKCASRDYTVRDTAWGIESDCGACGHHNYVSIGD